MIRIDRIIYRYYCLHIASSDIFEIRNNQITSSIDLLF